MGTAVIFFAIAIPPSDICYSQYIPQGGILCLWKGAQGLGLFCFGTFFPNKKDGVPFGLSRFDPQKMKL